MEKKAFSFDEFDAGTLRKMGVTKPRTKTFTAEHERQFAIKVLNVICSLQKSERSRVLRRAVTMNET